jgi:hypothetical protein
MRTTDVVRERALALAGMGRDDDAAVEELIEAAAGKRVAIVMARQELETAPGGDSRAGAAASLLHRALSARVWADADVE